MKDIEEVTDAILADISAMEDISSMEGEELSQIALRLSVNKAFIGEKLAKLDFDLSKMAASRKLEWGRTVLGQRAQGKLAKEAEIFADGTVKEKVEEEMTLEQAVNILKNLRRDVSDIITTIQTRIKQLKDEVVEVRSASKH